jgi:hypothetical protein
LELEVFPARIYPVTMSEPAAPAPEIEAKPSRGLGSYVVWVFVLVMVYVLGSGPLRLLGKKGALGGPYSPVHNAVVFIYRPVDWAYRHTPLQRPLGMYWHLWRPDMYQRSGKLVRM